ncbi:MAG: hypothetical protein ABIY51_14375 [Ferruginibacter sp.]
MEKEYYTTDFEQLLKDSTEDFKMYPSRRVWNSLYNNLHPANRWPSLAVCLLLVTAILYIGVTNNNAINASSRLLSSSQIVTDKNAESSNLSEDQQKDDKGNIPQSQSTKNIPYQKFLAEQDRVKQLLSFDIRLNNNDASPTTAGKYNSGINIENNSQTPSYVTTSQENSKQNTTTVAVNKNVLPITTEDKLSIQTSALINQVENNTTDLVLNEGPAAATNKAAVNKTINQSLDNNDKAWIDNYAFYNRNNKGKWKAKASLQYYITPSIGFRDINDNTAFKPGVNNSLVNANNNMSKDIDQQAAINLEAGAAMLYGVSRKLRLKGGLQLNYTNYNVNAYELKHPSQTTLLLNSGNYTVMQPYNTLYANSPALSSRKLNNKTVQVSIPIGVDYKIAGNNRIQWFAGATAQPTYIISGDAYLISSDMKFYVNDNSMINRWNLNTAVETFVSYKTNRGIVIHAGPQVRYQLFSTYSKQYTYTEKLYNVGLKMGITRNF